MNSPRQGPLDEVEIYRLITEKAINASTLVWNETLPDWKKLSETEFASHLGKSSPPPLPAIIETPNAEPVVIAHPPIRKDNEPSRTERLSVRSIFWMLVGIFILGSVGLFIFQHRSDLKLIVAQSWSIGAAAGGQAALGLLLDVCVVPDSGRRDHRPLRHPARLCGRLSVVVPRIGIDCPEPRAGARDRDAHVAGSSGIDRAAGEPGFHPEQFRGKGPGVADIALHRRAEPGAGLRGAGGRDVAGSVRMAHDVRVNGFGRAGVAALLVVCGASRCGARETRP